MLWFARRETGFEADSEATLRSLDIPVEHLSTDEIRHRWPGTRTDDLAWGLFEPEGGLLLARRSVEVVARAARRAGVDVRIAAVRPPEPGAGGRLDAVTLLDGSRIAAEAFVFACGPWLPTLFPDSVGARIRVTKQNVHYLGPAPGDARWMAPRFPSWVDYATTFYGIGAVATTGVKVATDSYGPPFDPSSADRFVDPDALAPVRDYCRVRFPDLADAPVVETRVCQYETTEDAHFVIDRHPSLEDVWLVGGGSGHGFKHGPVIGRYVAALLDGHEPTEEERRFSWTRDRSAVTHLRTSAELV
jgi:glycine/D-amino acid oxidase-like deaminating enzyme